jgi:hypothetical protein
MILAGALAVSAGNAQNRSYEVHTRSMVHQTIFNTGELGRAYNAGGSIDAGQPSLEWPPNSATIIDRTTYPGQHNSFGSGVWFAASRSGSRYYSYCGAVSTSGGDPVTVEGMYSSPISIERRENYPILANGNVNLAYNPDEAEEIIVSKWQLLSSGSAYGVTVTRTSRAWSFPGYDGFIIYEYEFENTSPDTLKDVHVVFTNSFAPSMFGFMKQYNRWAEADYRGQPPNGTGNTFSRMDVKRWMTYTHDRDGKPEANSSYFRQWSQPGDRGGLNSPQAVGLVVLYYDSTHLAHRRETAQVWTSTADTIASWDDNGHLKQPYLYRFENGNLAPASKTQSWLDPTVFRKTGPAQGVNDSAYYRNADAYYWMGRAKAATNLSWWQPVNRALGFYPYRIPPGQSIRFATAEVVGYGAGVRGDRVYRDAGGVTRDGIDVPANPNKLYFNPVPSFYDTLQYPYLGPLPYMGSSYLSNHPLPWYVTPGAVSVRDVADRAIQIYSGAPLVKHDSVQYEPLAMAAQNGHGVYNTISIPVPSPVIRVDNTIAAVNKISWGPQVESFTSPRLHAPLHYYKAYKSGDPLGPWILMDSIGIRDPRYWRDTAYVMYDTSSNIGEYYNYAVVSVDTLGGQSGLLSSSVLLHETRAPAAKFLGKVYVGPNPLIVTNGIVTSDALGEPTDRLQFFGLTEHCTIRIFSYSGQLINTIRHDADSFTNPWYQVSRNSQVIASGVYFFVVNDDGGAQSRGKFVIIH